MNYRPITDTWLLGRPKVKFYGSYPCGFLQRARDLLGVHPLDAVLHVCAGRVRDYSSPENGVVPGRAVAGFGPNDKTLDIDPTHLPDFLRDARDPFPPSPLALSVPEEYWKTLTSGWRAILLDPPYTVEDAKHYNCGSEVFPSTKVLLENAYEAVIPGGKIGILHYLFCRPPKDARLVAKISVNHGYSNRDRCYTVFERPL